MKIAHSGTWSKERKLKNMENEKHTLSDLGYGEKHSKTQKMRNAHCGTWSMATKLKSLEKETQTL
jgi:hypothetical protein